MKVRVGDRVMPTIYPATEADWTGEVVEINPERPFPIMVKHDRFNNVIWCYLDSELDIVARAVVLRGKRPIRLAGNNHRFTVRAGQRITRYTFKGIHHLDVR